MALAATVACVPAWGPNAAAYMDNAPHLVEAHLLATRILPEDAWYTGWSDQVGVGSPVGLLNAPLAWVLLAALHRLGAPLEATYALLATASNVVFGLALLRLGRRLLADPRAATLAALLGVTCAPDVWGVGGLAGGMWPYRLGVGLLVLEMSRAGEARSLAERGLLGAAATLAHLFAFLFLGIWTAVRLGGLIRSGDRRELLHTVAGGALTVGLSAFYLVPLRDGAVRDFSFLVPVPWPALQILGVMVSNVEGIVQPGGPIPTLGGVVGAVVPALFAVGVGLGLATRRLERPRALAVEVAVFVIIVTALALGTLLARSLALGPVPWRYFCVLRMGLCLLAAPGLLRLFGAPWGQGALALLTVGASVWTGRTEIPPLEGQVAADWADYGAAMSTAASIRQGAAVYVEDPWGDPEAPLSLRDTHIGALLPIRHGAPVFGTWYGVSPDRLNPELSSELGTLLGMAQGEATAEKVQRRLRIYGAGAVVAVSARLARLLAETGQWTEAGRFGSISVWASREPPLPIAGLPPGDGRVEVLERDRGLLRLAVSAPAPATVRVRQAWHPWWEAQVSGAATPVRRDPRSGLVLVDVPGEAEVELRWVAHDRALGAGGSLLTAALLLVTVPLRRGRRAARG